MAESTSVKTYRCSSKFSNKIFSYTWKIHKFDEIPFIHNYPICSPSFVIDKKTNSRWQISMTKHTFYACTNDMEICQVCDIPDFEYGAEKCYICACSKACHIEYKRIGFRLFKCKKDSVWDFVSYFFTLKSSNGDDYDTQTREEPGRIKDEKEQTYSCVSEKLNGELKIFDEKYIEVTCYIDYSTIHSRKPEEPLTYDGKRFDKDLRRLYYSKIPCDIELNINKKVLSAHKVVLLAAFPGHVDLRKFSSSIKKPEIKVYLDMNYLVAEAMISFMYTGRALFDFPMDLCIQLHEAAKRYGVYCLDHYVSDYFRKNLPRYICGLCIGIGEEKDCLESVKEYGEEYIKELISGKLSVLERHKTSCPHRAG